MDENTTTQQQYQQPQYQQPQQQYQPQDARPVAQLKTDRSLAKFILLSLITFGIYGLVVTYGLSEDINTVCGRYDGKKNMNYLLVLFILGPITCGIFTLIWFHTLSERAGAELARRGINYSFGAADFWLWNVLGSLILVGPFVYCNKLIKTVNLLNADFNVKG